MGDTGDEGRSYLIDVSDVSLRQIEEIEATVIGRALQQVLDEADGHQEAVAGFDSKLGPVPSRLPGASS